jgi:DNA helicase-2/ATP-dependent DNA helicase PcrA
MRGLYLLHASRRTQYGGASYRDPSRFLGDIPAHLLRPAALRPGRPRPVYADAFEDAESEREEWAEPARTPTAASYRKPPARRLDTPPAWMTEPDPYLEPAPSGPSRAPAFQKGDQVAHPAFGQGVVLESQVIADDEQVTVLFRGHPTPKKLSMAFARLERV